VEEAQGGENLKDSLKSKCAKQFGRTQLLSKKQK